MEDVFEEKNNNESLDLRRYLRVILKKWWLVGLVTLVVTVPWILYLKKQPPVYEAEAWISFENVGGELPENLIQQRSLKLKSRSFVEEVTAELGLTVQLIQEEDKPELLRNDVFNKIATTRTAVTGIYSFLYSPLGTCAIYRGMSRVASLF